MSDWRSIPGDVETFVFAVDGAVPNSVLPLILQGGVLPADDPDPPAFFERLFARNGWTGAWRNGIYDFHHYHSTAHEVLGIAAGGALVRFGGEAGADIALAPGDVAVLPAGTGHRRLAASPDLLVVGAYAEGRDCDLIRADPARIAAARARIASVPLARADPVGGPNGPLARLWAEAAARR